MEATVSKKFGHKIISISPRRQITIPQKLFELLSFGTEAECFVRGKELVIRPLSLQQNTGGEFAEQILADLIDHGLTGQELLAQFKQEQRKIRPAVERMIEEADALAESDYNGATLRDIFQA